MGETASQPANEPPNQPTGHPENQPTGHPPKKKKWHASTWVALASAATAIAAAVISGFQVNLAGQQNTEAERQQLVSLTTTIGQLFTPQASTTTPAPGTLAGLARTAAAASTLQGQVAQLQVDGQAGAVLIRDLNGNGVAGIEYVEVARALYYTGDSADAITFYNEALNAPPYDATTRGDALRYLGSLYYALGRNVTAHQDMMRATKVFGRHSVQSGYYVANTIAQAYLQDASGQILDNGCRIATADMVAAQHALGSYAANAINQAFQAADTKAYPLKCSGSG